MTEEEREARRLAKEEKEREKEAKRWEKEEKERQRLEIMRQYERQYEESCAYICGIDEVGRGPLAGPVVAAAVILPKGILIEGVNDSKQLTEKKREKLYPEILEKALAVGVGMASNEVIDEINILQATYSAMRDAIANLSILPDVILVDAVHIPEVEIPQVSIIKGDAKSLSIACASIVAKVSRDHMMQEYDQEYPLYGFAGNKGYGSAAHMQALQEYGPCPIHRRTFITKILKTS